jgi:hypothetical protein
VTNLFGEFDQFFLLFKVKHITGLGEQDSFVGFFHAAGYFFSVKMYLNVFKGQDQHV